MYVSPSEQLVEDDCDDGNGDGDGDDNGEEEDSLRR